MQLYVFTSTKSHLDLSIVCIDSGAMSAYFL